MACVYFSGALTGNLIVSEPVLDIVHKDNQVVAATKRSMYKLNSTMSEALAEAAKSKHPYWSARVCFEDVHIARDAAKPETVVITPLACGTKRVWTSTKIVTKGTTWHFPANKVACTDSIVQMVSARSAAMYGLAHEDAYLLQQENGTFLDTFNRHNKTPCVFGMDLSDSPTLYAHFIDDRVALVAMQQLDTTTCLSLPTPRARKRIQDTTGLKLLRTFPTPLRANLSDPEIPPETQIVTTTGPYVRVAHKLNSLKSLRSIISTCTVTDAENNAIPEHVVVVKQE